MRGVNKAIIIGNLGKDPELRYTNSGTAVAHFSVATTESWNNKQTQNREEKTEWHNIVVWGRMAEICNEYLKKGRPVFIEGRIQTRSWEDKEGHKRYTTEIVANNVQFLGSRGETAQIPEGDSMPGSTGSANLPPEPMEAGGGGGFQSDEEIPF
jgi:single-strand DNA-binding protein